MKARMKPKPPTLLEREVLDVLLLELRRAMRMRGQLTIVLDPFAHLNGVEIFASPNTEGRSYTIEKPLEKMAKKKRGRR